MSHDVTNRVHNRACPSLSTGDELGSIDKLHNTYYRDTARNITPLHPTMFTHWTIKWFRTVVPDARLQHGSFESALVDRNRRPFFSVSRGNGIGLPIASRN